MTKSQGIAEILAISQNHLLRLSNLNFRGQNSALSIQNKCNSARASRRNKFSPKMLFLLTYYADARSIEKEANNDSFSPFLKTLWSQLSKTFDGLEIS